MQRKCYTSADFRQPLFLHEMNFYGDVPDAANSPLRCFRGGSASGRTAEARLKIRLQEQPFLILQALLESPGQIVTREELQKKVWPGDTFVDFDHGLHAAVNRLRQALNDAADSPRFVETVARRGYRFIGQVQAPAPVLPGIRSLRHVAAQFSQAEGKSRGWARSSASQRRSSWPHSWFSSTLGDCATGFSDPVSSITCRASPGQLERGCQAGLFRGRHDRRPDHPTFQTRGFKVISHTSVMRYKGTNTPLPQIARELNVDAVVEGAVQLSGNHVRINAQLVDGRSDQHIWADVYDRDLSDVLLLQE